MLRVHNSGCAARERNCQFFGTKSQNLKSPGKICRRGCSGPSPRAVPRAALDGFWFTVSGLLARWRRARSYRRGRGSSGSDAGRGLAFNAAARPAKIIGAPTGRRYRLAFVQYAANGCVSRRSPRSAAATPQQLFRLNIVDREGSSNVFFQASDHRRATSCTSLIVMCWFSATGDDDLTTRSGGRRSKSTKPAGGALTEMPRITPTRGEFFSPLPAVLDNSF
jgi:hypothetical protein